MESPGKLTSQTPRFPESVPGATQPFKTRLNVHKPGRRPERCPYRACQTEVGQIRIQCVYEITEGGSAAWASPSPPSTCLSPHEHPLRVLRRRMARPLLCPGPSLCRASGLSAQLSEGMAGLPSSQAHTSLSASGKQAL